MKPLAVLCVDSESAQHPESLGLDGESLDAQGWLGVICDAARARASVPAIGAKHVWVAGSDDIAAINLAAALVHDGCPVVELVAFQGTGSLYSRAAAAGIERVLDRQSFVREYALTKSALFSQPITPGGSAPLAPAGSAAVPPARVGPSARPLDHAARRNEFKTVSGGGAGASQAPVPPTVVMPAFAPVPLAGTAARGFAFTVVGAAGGVGKSTIAVMTALATASAGKRTVLVDADLQCGDVHYLMGDEKALHIDDLLNAPGRIDALEVPAGKPVVVAAPQELEKSEMVASALPSLVDALRQRFECVVVNTGPAWDDLHMDLIGVSDSVLFVLDQRPTAIRLCRHVLDLCARCSVATQPFVFVLNRCGRGALFSSIDVSVALSGAKAVEVLDGGKVVEELLGCGQPFDLLEARCGTWTSVRKAVLPLVGANGEAVSQTAHAPKKKWRNRVMRRQEAACL